MIDISIITALLGIASAGALGFIIAWFAKGAGSCVREKELLIRIHAYASVHESNRSTVEQARRIIIENRLKGSPSPNASRPIEQDNEEADQPSKDLEDFFARCQFSPDVDRGEKGIRFHPRRDLNNIDLDGLGIGVPNVQEEASAPLGWTRGKYNYLAKVGAMPAKQDRDILLSARSPMTPKEISRSLSIDESRVSIVLERLIDEGYVDDLSDGRYVMNHRGHTYSNMSGLAASAYEVLITSGGKFLHFHDLIVRLGSPHWTDLFNALTQLSRDGYVINHGAYYEVVPIPNPSNAGTHQKAA